jgi:choline kinase
VNGLERSIEQAVILAAGLGSRLRKGERDFLKPLYPLCGRPLISYVLHAFSIIGVKLFHIVVGFEKDELVAGLNKIQPPGTEFRFVENPDYSLANGVSLLKAGSKVSGRFFLSMADHLFEPAMVDRLEQGARQARMLHLAIDRKLDSIFDMNDATKVQTQNDQIMDIGKSLRVFDAVDTGLFICPDSIFDHLQRTADRQEGNCSLSDAVQSMATSNLARVVDMGSLFWQDVDTPEMFHHAQKFLLDNNWITTCGSSRWS